jgi:5-methylthioadenosine/S-adenosylhomocysteine deaminase
LATVHDSDAELDLFEEMRMFIQNHPRITAEACVNMVTQNAALALGLQQQVGSLEPGKSADLITLPCSEVGGDVAEQIVAHQGDVDAVMINGEWVAGARKAT